MIQYIRILAHQLAPLYKDQQQQEQVAWWIVQSITGKTMAELIVVPYSLTESEQKMVQHWIQEHVHHNKPLQYLCGSVPFLETTLLVEPPLLIPRPETEEWVANLCTQLESLADKKITILDLCTGSGAIAIALAQRFPEFMVYATDISDQALALARKNAEHNKITNIIFMKSDLFESLKTKKFDLIVANPPYLSHEEWQLCDPAVRLWEDYQALVASDHGLGIIKKIIAAGLQYLVKDNECAQKGIGQLYVEIGYKQGAAVKEYMERFFAQAKVLKDCSGLDRVVVGIHVKS